MSIRARQCLALLAALPLLVGLPLLGAGLAGKPLTQYMEFPPTTHYVQHAPFSWPFFAVMVAITAGVVTPLVTHVLRSQSQELSTPGLRAPGDAVFPWWGWAALIAGILAWILAWTRFPWFSFLQPLTFTPQWLAFIGVVNALTKWRSGRCLFDNHPARVIGLFLLSASFWWFFEYLNRFVQNWYYVGIRNFSPFQYFLYATLPFSTVLPAVISTSQLLATFPTLTAGLERFVQLRPREPRLIAAVGLLASSLGLAGLAIWPNYLFPLVWLAPLGLVTAFQALLGCPTMFATLRHGDWRRIVLLALAALICGFFWELWNYGSLAKWIYSVPFVNRFRIFEMPLVGYAGYLPFGLECGVIADIIPTAGETALPATTRSADYRI